MKKNYLLNVVMMLAIVLLCTGFVSCSNDDDDEATGKELIEKLQGSWKFQKGTEKVMGMTITMDRSSLSEMKSSLEDLMGERVEFWDETLSFNGYIVNIEQMLVVAVVVTDGHIAHAAVCAQVNSVLVPAALGTVAAITAIAHHAASALGRHRPLLDIGEVRSVGITRGAHSNGKVLSSIAGILGTSPEANATTEGHLRRHKVIVRCNSSRHIAI